MPNYPDEELYAALRGIHSVFANLIHLASLTSEGHADLRGLEAVHLSVFREWLSLDLRGQTADLEVCARQQAHSAYRLIRHWIDPRHQWRLVPPAAQDFERELFVQDMQVLFMVID